jgi:hypothetical protein
MKWRIPTRLEERKKLKFAFLPVICSDGYARWLRWLEHHQEYRLLPKDEDDKSALSHGKWVTLSISPPKGKE